MGENTKIEWAKHTFNPWIGCTKVSPGCDHCYAETFAHRFGGGWGKGAPRRLTSESNWKLPLRWNRAAEKAGRRDRVFCASLADVFDNEVPDAWRDRLFALIDCTPNLDWLLLTKRPQVALKYMNPPSIMPNVWLGTSVENQPMADLRIPTLLKIPAAKRFLSVEPLLGPVDLWSSANYQLPDGSFGSAFAWGKGVNWVIVGGESGPKARPMHPAWARSIRDQCVAAGVPFFYKQWGEWAEVGSEALPERFSDPACDRFRCLCSNGFVGPLTMESAILHSHPRWPQCFPDGPDANAICKNIEMLRVGKKAAGRLLDGREWNEVPT